VIPGERRFLLPVLCESIVTVTMLVSNTSHYISETFSLKNGNTCYACQSLKLNKSNQMLFNIFCKHCFGLRSCTFFATIYVNYVSI